MIFKKKDKEKKPKIQKVGLAESRENKRQLKA